MNLQLPITIFDELDEEIIKSTALLDLASGEIRNVEYVDYDATARGLPVDQDDYAFTSGTLSHEGKDVEFKVDVEKHSGRYSVSPNELLDIKVRAARLFAGLDGGQLLAGANATAKAARKKKLH